MCSSHKPYGESPNSSTPVSYWINDKVGCPHGYLTDFFNVLKDIQGLTRCVADPCVVESAKAIVKSGRPYPNEHQYPVTGEWLYDVWVGTHLYEMKVKKRFLVNQGFDLPSHPQAYHSVFTSVSDLLSIPEPKFKDPHVGGTLTGEITCSHKSIEELKAVTTRDKAIAYAKYMFEHNMASKYKKAQVIERPDIKMTEVLMPNYALPNGKISYLVEYFPHERNMTQTIEGQKVVTGIYCNERYNPNARAVQFIGNAAKLGNETTTSFS
jgi:hypothetical protein